MNIYGAKTFLSKLEDRTSKLDKSINDLKEEVVKLEDKISKRKDKYDIEEIKETQRLKDLLDTVKETLQNAENERADLIKDNSMQVYEDTVKLLDRDRQKKRDKYKEKRLKIQELRDQADALNQEVLELDDTFTENEITFINEVFKYIDADTTKGKGSYSQNIKKLLQNKVVDTLYKRQAGTVLGAYREHYKSPRDYGLKEVKESK